MQFESGRAYCVAYILYIINKDAFVTYIYIRSLTRGVSMEWRLQWKISALNVLTVLVCIITHTHTHVINKHLWDAKGSSGIQSVWWKFLTQANISWCVLHHLHTGCCISGRLLSELCILMSTLLLQQVMQQQVSLCLPVWYTLSVFLCLCASLSLFLFWPLPLYFSQFCWTAIIMCLPNTIHLEATISPLGKRLFLLALTLYHSFPLTLTVMGETEKAPCCCLASRFLLFTAEALTVLLQTSLGRMDTLTFPTLKCGSAWYYL